MGVYLLGYGGALGSLDGNLGLKMREDFCIFLLAWWEVIEPIFLTSELYIMLMTLKGFSMDSSPMIPPMYSYCEGSFR